MIDFCNTEINVTLRNIPKVLGDWVNYEINNIISIAEFIHNLQKELDKTDLKVEHVKFREMSDRFEPFIVFKLSKNLELFFYKKAIFDGDIITLQLKEMVESDDETRNLKWLYESNIRCPYIDTWKHAKYQGMATPIPRKHKRYVDILEKAVDTVIENHSVEKIDM